ncbi:MAG: hypothetical protein KJ007_02875 [Burkholderiales bacterium]|nr:hypothetical protein [Burkholderiales bacterium]
MRPAEDIPFARRDGPVRMNGTRVIESLIIAALTGAASVAGSYLWTVPTLRVQIESLAASVAEMREAGRAQANQIQSQQSDIVRLQAQMVQVQAQSVELQRAISERITLLERRVFNIPR